MPSLGAGTTEARQKVRLMPPRYLKPYVKRNKNDAADAETICEVVTHLAAIRRAKQLGYAAGPGAQRQDADLRTLSPGLSEPAALGGVPVVCRRYSAPRQAMTASGPKAANPRSRITKDGTRIYRASKRDCDSCALKPSCPNTPARKIPRDLDEDARDVARSLADTPAYERSRHRRKKVKMLFAHLKRILRLSRLRRRGPSGARDEFLLHRPEPQKARRTETDASVTA